MVGLITDNDETAYREEVRDLTVWCQDNNLSQNVSKTKQLIVDYWKRRAEQAPIKIESGAVREFHISRCPNHDQTYQDSCEEGTTKPFPPPETEKIWHGSPDPQKVLHLHHQEHSDLLHHRLVWQLLGI